MSNELNSMEERGGLSASASTTDDQTQNQVSQATDLCGIVSTDTTFDTTAQAHLSLSECLAFWRQWARQRLVSKTPIDMAEARAALVIAATDDCIAPCATTDTTATRPWHFGQPDYELARRRLEFAADDLFEALDRLMSYVDSPCGGCGERNAPSEVFAQTRAAMDKAMGIGNA